MDVFKNGTAAVRDKYKAEYETSSWQSFKDSCSQFWSWFKGLFSVNKKEAKLEAQTYKSIQVVSARNTKSTETKKVNRERLPDLSGKSGALKSGGNDFASLCRQLAEQEQERPLCSLF